MAIEMKLSASEMLAAIIDKLKFYFLSLIRYSAMLAQRGAVVMRISRQTKPRIFSLDAHVSVIEDIRSGLVPLSVSLTNWNIAGGNPVFRRFFVAPDPVRGLTARNWQRMDEISIRKFKKSYHAYLQSFDGFLSTYPPAFAEAYEELGKPTLVLTGTRYEWPYTFDSRQWHRLDSFLVKNVNSGRLTLVANNRADADYIEYFTGLTPSYVPSLCDYTRLRWDGSASRRLIQATRSPSLASHINRITNGDWRDIRAELGKFYNWKELARGSVVCVIPYNISTMSLFELATMGVPVIVPSQSLMKELHSAHIGVLSDLSFIEMSGASTSGLRSDNPNNYNSEGYLDWWLERADFYNSKLMPNVIQINKLEELNDLDTLLRSHIDNNYMHRIEMRNQRLFAQREELLLEFVNRL